MHATAYRPTPTGPNGKFDVQGVPQYFPGNTILCHLTGTHQEAVTEVVAALREKVGNDFLAWLPPSSYHVTLFEGVCHFRRDTSKPNVSWPKELPTDTPLAEVNQFMSERLQGFDAATPAPICFEVDQGGAPPTLASIALRAGDDLEDRRLRTLRNRLSQRLGIRTPAHDDYRFHISFGYYLRRAPEAWLVAYEHAYQQAIRALFRKVPIIELGLPEYCEFESMLSFKTQFFLDGHAAAARSGSAR